MTPQTDLRDFCEGVFPSNRCPCGADGVPPTQPYCDDCLDRLDAVVGVGRVRGGGAA